MQISSLILHQTFHFLTIRSSIFLQIALELTNHVFIEFFKDMIHQISNYYEY